MKVLQLGKFYPAIGGLERVMYDIAMGLSLEGEHCDILCTTLAKHDRRGDIKLSNRAHVLRVSYIKKVAGTMIAPSMISRLRKIHKDYDLIHIHHPDPMACLALFLSGYKGPVVLHWHSDILKQKNLLKLYLPLQNWLLRRADVIVGTTPTYVRESPHLQSVQDKVKAIPIGIDELTPEIEQIARIKKEYPGKKIIFAVGRLVGYKGFEYLIKAARQLGDEYIILISGKGELRGRLETLIREEGVADRVRLLGFVDKEELAGYYGACHLFCLSSIWKTEAFAIVQVEAMSCGKPVIATRIPESGVSWVNADGISGKNVEPENAEALAKAIQEVCSDEQLYRQLAVGARDRYETMFRKEKMIHHWMQLYQDLLSEKAIK